MPKYTRRNSELLRQTERLFNKKIHKRIADALNAGGAEAALDELAKYFNDDAWRQHQSYYAQLAERDEGALVRRAHQLHVDAVMRATDLPGRLAEIVAKETGSVRIPLAGFVDLAVTIARSDEFGQLIAELARVAASVEV